VGKEVTILHLVQIVLINQPGAIALATQVIDLQDQVQLKGQHLPDRQGEQRVQVRQVENETSQINKKRCSID